MEPSSERGAAPLGARRLSCWFVDVSYILV